MKNFLVTAFVIVMTFTGCGDNAYDGETGLVGNSSTIAVSAEDTFKSLGSTVLAQNSSNAVTTLKALQLSSATLKSDVSSANLTQVHNDFKNFMMAYKAVEVTYIAGDYESSLSDTLRLMDFFHNTNEDIPGQLDVVLESNASVNDLMFKNSLKSINALEYILYNRELSIEALLALMQNGRLLEMADVCISKMITRLETIETFYSSFVFETNEETAKENLSNILKDSAFKLKEWRIGDAAGLTAKYKDSVSSERLEYRFSHLSLEAIKSILVTHKKVMNDDNSNDFGDYAAARQAQSEVQTIRTTIDEALVLVESIESNLEAKLTSSEVETLYNKIDVLQDSYLGLIIGALNVTAKIIEADGD
jgi:hypothetical protein